MFFYMILGGCIHVFDIFTYFENLFYTYFITFLDFFKDHFARPPPQKFGLLCNFDFPIFLNLPVYFIC